MQTQPITLTPDQVEFAQPQQAPQTAAPVTLTPDQVEFASGGTGDTTAYSSGKPSNPVLSNADAASIAESAMPDDTQLAIGAVKGLGQTLNTIGQGVRKLTGLNVPDESQYLHADTLPQQAGSGVESVLEFMGGDEALKSLSFADKLGVAAKVSKVLEEHPWLAKLASAGADALRQGTVGTVQGAAKGGTASEAGKQGLAAAAVAGLTHGAGAGIEALKPSERAAALYTRALAPAGKVDSAKAMEVAPRLVRQVGFQGSMAALKSEVADYLAKAEEGLSTAEDALPADKQVDTQAAVDSLRNLADSKSVAANPDAPLKRILHTSNLLDEYGKPIVTEEDIPNPANVESPDTHSSAVRNAANTLANHIEKIDPSIKNVIAQRRILDDGLHGVYAGADPALNGNVLAQKRAADVLRAKIAESSPEMAAANGEYSFWRKVNDVIHNTEMRRAGKPGGLLNLAAAGEAGAHLATGNVPGAIATFAGIKAMKGLMQDVPSLTGRAALLNKLATHVGTGDISGTAMSLARQVAPPVAANFMRLYQQAKRDIAK